MPRSKPRPEGRGAKTSVAKVLEREEPDERARGLHDVCDKWADCHEWYYREAAECYAFYHGDHYGYWDGYTRSWIATPDAPSDMVRLTVNLIQPIAEQGTSILTQEKVQFGVVAATSEGRDSATSEAGDAVLEHGWHHHRMSDLYHKSALAGFVCGTGIIHEQWDDSRGRPIHDGVRLKSPDEFDDLDGMDSITAEDLFEPVVRPEGDAFLEHLNPEEWVPDPASRGPYDGVGCFVRREIGRAELFDQFPKLKGDEDDEENREVASTGTGDDALYRLNRLSKLSTRSADWGTDHGVRETEIVYIFYQRSTPDRTKGYMAIFACGKMLYEGDNPVYPTDEGVEANESWPRICWPIMVHRHLIRENSPWGLGPVAAMIDCNKALNGLWSKTVQHAAKIANSKVKLPKGLDVEWTDEDGQVVRIPRNVDGNSIGYINPPPMSNEFGAAADRAQGYMEYLSGVNSATAGQQPYADTSGRALQLLQNRDFGRLSPVKQRLDSCWAEVARYYLFLFRRHASNERKVLVVGENKRTVMREFDRSALAAGLDVVTFNDQSIPRNPSDRILWVTNLAQNILDMTVPSQRELVFELLNLRDFRGFIDHQSPHRSKARRENLKLMRGDPVAVWPGDDHLQHKATLEELILSEEFESQVQREIAEAGVSQTYQLVMAHYMEHEQALVQVQPGGPPAPGMPAEQPIEGAAPPDAAPQMPAPQMQDPAVTPL